MLHIENMTSAIRGHYYKQHETALTITSKIQNLESKQSLSEALRKMLHYFNALKTVMEKTQQHREAKALQDKQVQIDELKRQVEEQRRFFSDSATANEIEVKELKSKLSRAKATIEKQDEITLSLSEMHSQEKESLVSQIREQQQYIEALQKNEKELDSQLRLKINSIELDKQRIRNEMESILQHRESVVDDLKERLNTLQQKFNELQDAHIRTTNQKTKAEEDLTICRSQYESAIEGKNMLSQQIRGQAMHFQKKLVNASSTEERMRISLQQLTAAHQTEVKSLHQQIQGLEQQIKGENDQRLKLERVKTETEQHLARLHLSYQSLQQESQRLKFNYNNCTGQLQTLNRNITLMQRKTSELEMKNKALLDENSTLKESVRGTPMANIGDLKRKDAEIASLKMKISRLNETCDKGRASGRLASGAIGLAAGAGATALAYGIASRKQSKQSRRGTVKKKRATKDPVGSLPRDRFGRFLPRGSHNINK